MTYQALIPKVAAALRLNYVAADPRQKGYRNESYKLTLDSGAYVNLIFHKNEREALQRIKSADMASAILSNAFLPVRTRFDKRTLRVSDGKNQVYAGVYTYLPGKTIPWEAYTKDHIKLLGWAMSDMHNMWSIGEADSGIYLTDELRGLLERMDRYFSSAGVSHALENKLKLSVKANLLTYKSLFDWLDRTPESGAHILHMDLVRGNVLFDSNNGSPWSLGDVSLTGIIDFEKAAVGHPVFDIARTLAFLLVDCTGKDRRTIYKYFLESGYNKRGSSSFKRSDDIGGLPAAKVLDMLVGFFLLHDFYKFLRHTPYESLPGNHHFLRTRDILVSYNMVRYV